MKLIHCRSCNSKVKVIPISRQKVKYKNKVICFTCWSSPKTLQPKTLENSLVLQTSSADAIKTPKILINAYYYVKILGKVYNFLVKDIVQNNSQTYCYGIADSFDIRPFYVESKHLYLLHENIVNTISADVRFSIKGF